MTKWGRAATRLHCPLQMIARLALTLPVTRRRNMI